MSRCALVSLISLLAPFAPVLTQAEEQLVIYNVNVVPMDQERILAGQSVLIEDGLIRVIADDGAIRATPGARVIDGTGKYLMPGLAEMHAHVPGANDPEHYRHDVLFLYLANGITLIRGMLGEPLHLELREQLEGGELLGPRLITAGPAFSDRSAPTPERGAELAREQKTAGYDFIKVASGSRAAFDAMAEAAHEVAMPFSGHVPAEVGVPGALQAGYASIDHLDAYMPALVDPETVAGIEGGFFGFRLAPHVEEERVNEIARRTREAGVWNVPTETLMHAVLIWDVDSIRRQRPEFRYMPPDIIDRWIEAVRARRTDRLYDRKAAEAFVQVRLHLIRALHEEGAGLLLGSDAPQFFNVPGFSIHPEMELMARAGLTPYEVLKMGTVNPSIFFGEEGTFGKVLEGARADLLLLDENPLDDLAHVQQVNAVIRDGKWISREEIERRLELIAQRYAKADINH